jgi:predicted nucleic acid-binding protein
MIFLDNDVLNAFRQPIPDDTVVSYLQEHRSKQWLVSSIVLYEFLSYHDTKAKQNRERRQIKSRVDGIAPLDESAAAEAANIGARLSAAGTSLDTGDLLIAAIARDQGGTLATKNKTDFDKTPIHELMDVDIVSTD